LQKISKLIIGDFNYLSIDWENFCFPPSCEEFVDTLLDLNLPQHVQQPTRNQAVLDLIFSTDPDISNVDILEHFGQL